MHNPFQKMLLASRHVKRIYCKSNEFTSPKYYLVKYLHLVTKASDIYLSSDSIKHI